MERGSGPNGADYADSGKNNYFNKAGFKVNMVVVNLRGGETVIKSRQSCRSPDDARRWGGVSVENKIVGKKLGVVVGHPRRDCSVLVATCGVFYVIISRVVLRRVAW